MIESPETPTPSLADRLDRFRLAVMADGERSIIMNPPVSDEDRTAAAAQLRQLDRIKAALPPADIQNRSGSDIGSLQGSASSASIRSMDGTDDDNDNKWFTLYASHAKTDRLAADALEAQAARITALEAAVAERNSLIGWLIMAKSCADHGQAPVWPLPAQLEELFQQLSVTMRDDWDDWRWRGIPRPDHTLTTPTEETP